MKLSRLRYDGIGKNLSFKNGSCAEIRKTDIANKVPIPMQCWYAVSHYQNYGLGPLK